MKIFRISALAAVAVVSVLAGCGGKETSSTPNGTESNVVGAPRCHTDGLQLVAIGETDAGLGHWVQRFGLINTTKAACTFFGYPGMGLKNAGGGDMPTNVVRMHAGQGYFGVGSEPTEFVIEPDETASFQVEGIHFPVGDETCNDSAGLILTPPDETTQLHLDFPLTACNHGELETGPVLPPGTKVASSAGVDRCHTADLRIDPVSGDAATGHWRQQFALTNWGQNACAFFGYPGMAMVDKNGAQMPTTVVRAHAASDSFLGIGREPELIVLQRAQTATFWIEGIDVQVGDEVCNPSAGFILTPPDETTQLHSDTSILACGHGQIFISPVL